MELSFIAYPDQHPTGTVIFISPVEDAATHTIKVRLELPNLQGHVRPQMPVTATFERALGKSLAIPASSVVRTGAADYVWVRDSSSIFHRRTVTLGSRSSDDLYPVTSGLIEGEEVATSGSFLVDSEHELTKTGGSTPMTDMPGMDMSKPAPPKGK